MTTNNDDFEFEQKPSIQEMSKILQATNKLDEIDEHDVFFHKMMRSKF